MNRREVVQKFLVGGTVLALAPSVLESCVKMTTDTSIPGGGTPADRLLMLIFHFHKIHLKYSRQFNDCPEYFNYKYRTEDCSSFKYMYTSGMHSRL